MAKDEVQQDISVLDKSVAALGATEEEQDMSRLEPIVVPVGAYTDPNDPNAAAGSVNFSLDMHPKEHNETYGQDASQRGRVKVATTMDAGEEAGGARPEDRESWKKADWQSQAREYGLSAGGNMDDLQKSVEDYESAVEDAKTWNAGEWQEQIDSAESDQEVRDLQALYQRSGANYSTVESAFESRLADQG